MPPQVCTLLSFINEQDLIAFTVESQAITQELFELAELSTRINEAAHQAVTFQVDCNGLLARLAQRMLYEPCLAYLPGTLNQRARSCEEWGTQEMLSVAHPAFVERIEYSYSP
jgi:hypothetical protein